MKQFALILILCASSFLGIFKSWTLKRRTEELRGIISAVEHIKTGISFGRKNLPSLFSEIEKDLCPLFYFVGKEDCGNTVYEKYKSVKNEKESRLCLADADKKTLDSFFISIGRSNEVEQKLLCDGVLERLAKHLAEAEEKYKKYGGLFSKSGVLAGLFIVVLFL